VPADGTTAATVRNGDFGTSPFFGQHSDRPQLVYTERKWDVGPGSTIGTRKFNVETGGQVTEEGIPQAAILEREPVDAF
jgi:hypothetical protein